MSSFFPDAINSWNNIITNFQNVPPFTYPISNSSEDQGVHDPLGLRYILRVLRVNLNPLRNHKRRHNFADTPSEFCNEDVEDTSHYMFECTRYATHRANLAGKVIEILQRDNLNRLGNQLELYLYGHRSLNLIDNRNIFVSTIKYIKDTQSFSPP